MTRRYPKNRLCAPVMFSKKLGTPLDLLPCQKSDEPADDRKDDGLRPAFFVSAARAIKEGQVEAKHKDAHHNNQGDTELNHILAPTMRTIRRGFWRLDRDIRLFNELT